MTSKQPAQRLRKSPGQVRSAVHQAVIDLLSDPGGADLTIPAVAQRAGVNHTASGYPDLLVDRLLGGPDTPRPT
ncbi:hypothetical protein ACWGEU_30850 [Streptomyces goshikiensis]